MPLLFKSTLFGPSVRANEKNVLEYSEKEYYRKKRATTERIKTEEKGRENLVAIRNLKMMMKKIPPS